MRTRGQNGAGQQRCNVLEVIGNALFGGMERYVLDLVCHLPDDQFSITCVCPFESAFTAELRRCGCQVLITPIHDEPPWRSIQLAVEAIRMHDIHLIHAHMPKAHVLAGLAGCLTQTPVLATVHGMNVTTHELGICRTTGSSLIAVCQEAYTQALALGVPPERVALIRNGVDVQAFEPGRDCAAFRDRIGVPRDAPLVGFVGRLAPEKGPDLFVRAADKIARQRPDAHFALVGDGDMALAVAALIEQLGLRERVHMAGFASDTAEVYPALDVVLQTSRSEGMPLALLEAMACGRPVVAIGVGGVPEIVEVGTTGLLAGAQDWEGVAIHALDLLARPERRLAMGRAARARAEQHFDIHASARTIAELFRETARRGSPYGVKWSAWPAMPDLTHGRVHPVERSTKL